MPASCTIKDVEASLQHAIARHTAQTGMKISLQVEKSMCQVKEDFILTKAIIATR
jgi:hypothetical protein